ncbi:MAG: polysaccharide deacetylase family protein [Candidatus Velthaea sp.]
MNACAVRAARTAIALAVCAGGLFGLYEVVERPQSQALGPTLVRGHAHVVALTFDDGPNPYVTPGVLDLLERQRVRGTFFVVGRAARAHPDLLRRMAADGDEIGNHTDTHAHLNALLTRRAIDAELDGARAAIVSATGREPRYLRPPFGARNGPAIAEARRRGYTVVMWTAMLEDEPSSLPPPALAQRLLAKVRDGAIIVLHDGDRGRDTRGGRTYEARALAPVIAALKARGYRFVTISELARS